MKYFWLTLLTIPLFAKDINKHNISFGMFDDKSGLSLLAILLILNRQKWISFLLVLGL